MQDNSFEAYNKYKEDVLNVLSKAYDFYMVQKMERQANTIKDNIEVIKSGEFEVVVVGEFSTGKSTFLNALMGEKFLPSYTKETTATINYLRNASESEVPGVAYFFDGHTEILPSLDYDIVAKYVSTKNKEMKVEESIEHLDLFLGSKFLENKVTLIDSPGLNGMKQGLGDITDAQIRRSHAVIFMFSAEQAGKRSEFEYLKRVKDQVDTVFLVLNKIDCVKESENETVEDKIQDLIDSYKTVFPEDTTLPEIIPIAAYPALVARSKQNLDYPTNHFDISDEEKIRLEKISLMNEFEEKLLHFLTNSEKTITQIREPIQRLSTSLRDSLSNYEAEIAIIEGQKDGAKLQEQISSLNTSMSELEDQLNKQRGETRRAVKTVERDILEALDKELEDTRRQGRLSIDELDNIDALGDYVELLNGLLGRRLTAVYNKLDQSFREYFFDAVQDQYNGVICALEERMEATDAHSVSFDVRINVSAKSINAGIENFNAMKNELKKKMDELETKKQNLSIKEDELIVLGYKSEEIKNKLERLEKSELELVKTFCPPEAVYITKQGTREVDRTGLFHNLRDALFGKKKETYSYEDRDDSERKEYISNYNKQQKILQEKQNELERKLDGISGAEKRLQRTQLERENVQKELEALRNEEKEMTARFNYDLDEKYNREIERVKKKALADMDNYLDQIRPEIRESLKKNRSVYVDILQSLVEQSVMAQIKQKKEECDNLIKLKEEANDNKETLLKEKNELMDQAKTLKKEADEILERIKSIEIEKLKYQTI